MKKKLLLIPVLFLVKLSAAQTISVLDYNGLNYIGIDNSAIKNQIYQLPVRPATLTVRVNSTSAFTATADGKAITGTPSRNTSGTALASLVPGSAVVNGTLTPGVAANGSNTITVKAVFSTAGYYTVVSDVKNGIRYYATGYANRAGQQDITLQAEGVPIQANMETVQIDLGGSKINTTVIISAGAAQTQAVFANSCTFGSFAGVFTEGKQLEATNTLTINVNITTAGRYYLTTKLVNGIFFSAQGNAVSTGPQTITFTGHGTPLSATTKNIEFDCVGTPLNKSLTITAATPDIITYSIPENVEKVEFTDPSNNDKYTISIPKAQENGGTDANLSVYENYIDSVYEGALKITPYGLLISSKVQDDDYKYGGPNYVHIFLDEMGNSLITSIPQGIPEMQYVVHVIYNPANAGKRISYGIKTMRGSFIGGNRIENSNAALGTLNSLGNSQLAIREYTLLIKTSTSDIDFELYRFENGVQTAQKLAYTINMTAYYTANISAGLLNTQLRNPSYSLEVDPTNTALNVAKETEGNSRGFGVIFATLYTSPITVIKYYRDKKKYNGDVTKMRNPVADFQLHSKNYLYMRPIWERIYPTVGVGISDKIFQNLFFGMNWEITRGGSLFVGGHYGKVNVFNQPEGFVFKQTNITSEQFNLYKNVDWRVGWAVGASLDFTILANLFR